MYSQLQQLEREIKNVLQSNQCPAAQRNEGLVRYQERHKVMMAHLCKEPCQADQIRVYLKVIQPTLESYRLFVQEVYRLKLNEPNGTLEMKQTFWREELQWIQRYFSRQAHDYHYYKSGNTELDAFYFPDTLIEKEGPQPTTVHLEWGRSKMGLFAQFMAMEKLQKYLISNLEQDSASIDPVETPAPRKKVTKFNLSVDQLGLMARAADDARIVDGRSFTKICEDLAPYVATPQRAQISAHSLRSNAYLADEQDKINVIKCLRKMIDFIQGY